jgi:hypothetical protein
LFGVKGFGVRNLLSVVLRSRCLFFILRGVLPSCTKSPRTGSLFIAVPDPGSSLKCCQLREACDVLRRSGSPSPRTSAAGGRMPWARSPARLPCFGPV